ncbi:MAG: putative addiction module antidote protein [Mesorhizobium sp.]|uniref:addiction module antidote protein n=1 Tax=Mesorhizobium sp. TaxID=1871066 RepID=UPI000FEA093F|nr:MAG: putative addiction module antidote protein [Mesorhizobium sp.]RWB96743.1 MAG: putative addiction module antidote protein [Mesorhizobium sp.]TIQ36343.1 MAG: putative addiction module antidote protein [Mesorhizobium sp.]
MTVETTAWDVSNNLDNEETIAHFLDEIFADGDPALIAAALGEIARARGMTQIAKAAGLSRESLYRALDSKGRPEFATVIKVVHAMGLRLSIEAVEPPASETRSDWAISSASGRSKVYNHRDVAVAAAKKQATAKAMPRAFPTPARPVAASVLSARAAKPAIAKAPAAKAATKSKAPKAAAKAATKPSAARSGSRAIAKRKA